MILKYTKKYLLSLRSTLITNDIAIAILSLIEALSLLYQIVLSSFKLSGYEIPYYYEHYLSYISFYDIIRKHLVNEHYPTFLFHICYVILVIYFVFKYFLLNFKIINKIIYRSILINFYDIIIFRFCIVFILDIFINKIIYGALVYSIFGLLIVFLSFGFIMFHISLHHVYIALTPIKTSSFDNYIMLITDRYFLIYKLIIAFVHNTIHYPMISKFLYFFLFTLNLLLLLHILYTIFYFKYSYISSLFTHYLRITFCFFSSSLSLYIIFIEFHDGFTFGVIAVNTLICSIFVCRIAKKASRKKMLQRGNEMGSIMYMITEKDSNAIETIILNHKNQCILDKCTLCQTKEQISCEKMTILLFEYLHRVCNFNKTIIFNELLDFLSLYNLCDLYVLYLTQKNYIKVLLKYNKIKEKIGAKQTPKSTNMNKGFQRINFELSLELLFDEIAELLLEKTHIQKNTLVLKTDLIASHIRNFLLTIKSFFKLELITPSEVIKLAHSFSLIKKKTDINYLVSKDNKFNYSCIINGYIFEEIFNNKISKTTSFDDMIHSAEELLTQHYKLDKLLLIEYDIVNATFTIQQCGKDFIEYKGQTIERMFPPFLRKAGKVKLLRILEYSTSNYFDFYFYNNVRETLERVKISFIGIPSIKNNNGKLNLLCNYKIVKDNLLLFEGKYLGKHNQKVLLMTSDSISITFKLRQTDIQICNDKKEYLTDEELFTEDRKSLDLPMIQEILAKRLNKTNKLITKQKVFNVHLKESIGPYSIYIINGNSKGVIETQCEGTSLIQTKNTNIEEIDTINDGVDFEMHFTPTHTGVSSSALSKTSGSTYNKAMKSINDEQNDRYKQFFRYTYYLITFNIVILCIIIIFLVIELMNNVDLETTFEVITNYYDFQNYFYISSLSLFSLTCNADYLSQLECINAFQTFGEHFNSENNLNNNQLITDYVSREINYKADVVISTLKSWELNHSKIKSKKKDEILSASFEFNTITDVNNTIQIQTVELTFEEAIKRFTNNVNQLTSYPDFLTSPVYPITSDGNGNIDMSNAMLEKTPKEDGTYLVQSQKVYYTMVINYQKYILRLISIGDLLYDYYDHKISSTSLEVLGFIIGFIVLHVFMMIMCLIFLFKFTHIHIAFFVIVYNKLSDSSFVEYYLNKIDILFTLLDLYKDAPINLYNKIIKLKQKEKSRKQRSIKGKFNQSPNMNNQVASVDPITKKDITINYEVLNKTYNTKIILCFIIKIIILFSLYYIVCLVFFLMLDNSLGNLSLMNKYTKGNYECSNQIYLNLGLIQIMSFTNQTDEMYYKFFYPNKGEGNYLRDNIQKTLTQITDIYSMEKQYHFFTPIAELIDINCDTLYEEINDYFINEMVKAYPESNYYEFFKAYCKSFAPLDIYKNPKLTMMFITYQCSTLLDMFVDRRYETYAYINNCDLIYLLYSEVLILLRPLRKFTYSFLSDTVITNIINDYSTLMIVFLVFNFAYESIILIYVKCHIINSIINVSKEIINVAKAFECFG